MANGQNVTINFTGGDPLVDGQTFNTDFIATPHAAVRQRPRDVALPAERPALMNRPFRAKRPGGKPNLRIENAADTDVAEIYIYDEITDPFLAEFFGLGISAAGFVQELQELKGRPLNVHINSPGGSVFEGLAIYATLRGHDAPVHVIVEGIAASIASVIAMAGDTVTMAPHSMLMIHDAWGVTMGNAADHEQQAGVLNKLSDNIAGVYADRGDKRVNWRQKMLAETWITDQEAVSMKLADRIDTQATPATNSFDLSRYRNAPADLAPVADADPTPTKRDAEQILRDAGFSVREAKVIASAGYAALEARDEPEQAADADEATTPGVTEEPAAEATGTVAADAMSIAARRAARERNLALLELLAG